MKVPKIFGGDSDRSRPPIPPTAPSAPGAGPSPTAGGGGAPFSQLSSLAPQPSGPASDELQFSPLTAIPGMSMGGPSSSPIAMDYMKKLGLPFDRLRGMGGGGGGY